MSLTNGNSWASRHEFGDRTWLLEVRSTQEFLAHSRGWQSWVVLVGSLLFTSLLGTLLLVTTGRTVSIEQIVEERTSALNRSNDQLAREIAERNLMAQQLRRMNETLEQRVEERTRALKASEQLALDMMANAQAASRAASEAALAFKESEERFRLVVESAPNAMIMVDDHGLMTLVNTQTEQLFDYTRQELIGHPIEMLVPERFRNDHPGHRTAFFRAPQTRAMGAGRDLFGRCRDGTEVPIEIGLNPIATTAGTCVLASIINITGRKQAEQALRESEQRHRTVLESALDAIVSIDHEGRIVEFNPAAERMFGYPRSVAIGRNMAELIVPSALRERHRIGLAHYLATGEGPALNQRLDFPALRADGSEFPVELTITRVGQSELPRFTGFIRDITDRKAAEAKVLGSLREKEILFKEIHHRVKNNLQVVSSLLNLQAERIQHPEALRAFADGRARIQSMALVHEKLYGDGSHSRVDFSDYLRDLTSQLLQSYNVSPGHINLRLELTSVALGLDAAIPSALIVNELVSNALKYAFPPGRAGEIQVRLQSENEYGVHIEVADDGVGFPAGFDWKQAPSLGLSLVQMLVRQLRGQLHLTTDPGVRFRVVFSQQPN